jgi:hypothetical protein
VNNDTRLIIAVKKKKQLRIRILDKSESQLHSGNFNYIFSKIKGAQGSY